MSELPPLPEPSAGTMLRQGREREKVYTADQMRAYAQEAVRQEREACEELCILAAKHRHDANCCAAAIRSRSPGESAQTS